MSLSPSQLAQRKSGITATDIAAISGLDQYRTAIDVWMDKTGRSKPFAGNIRTRWGHLLERPIRDDYAERHNVRVEIPGTLEHSGVPWAKATPDGICYPPRATRPRNGLEIKTHSIRMADQYGNPGTDQIPPGELVQCTWNMFVSGLDSWDLVAFIDGQPSEYHVDRDDDLIELLRADAEKFLVDHVRKDVPPDPDGSESYNRYLSTAYPQRLQDLVQLDGRPEAMALVRHLRLARDHLAQVTTEVEIVTQNLKAIIGCHAGVEWTDPEAKSGKGRITYKASEDGTSTDWYAAWRSVVTDAQLALSADRYDVAQLAHALIDIADENRSISAYTATVPGSRRFYVPKWWNQKAE